jgi:hypothetical protein
MSQAASTATAVRRSSRFVAWTRSWRAGLVPYDELPEEIELGEEHLVADAPGTWTEVPLRDALSVLAKLHPDEIRLVLPAPGDPFGLPGPGDFTGAALLAGEGVVASRLGFVPEVREYTSGSGDTFATVVWRTYALPTAPAGPTDGGAGEAEADLNAAVLDAATALTRLDIAQWRPEFASAIAALRRPDGGNELPPGYDPRVRQGERGGSDAVAGRRERSRRSRQRLRGARPRRGVATAGNRVPARAGRRLQRAADLAANLHGTRPPDLLCLHDQVHHRVHWPRYGVRFRTRSCT